MSTLLNDDLLFHLPLLMSLHYLGKHEPRNLVFSVMLYTENNTLVRRGGITNYHLIAYSFSNISAKNYQNRLIYIEVIVWNVIVVFLRHSLLGFTETGDSGTGGSDISQTMCKSAPCCRQDNHASSLISLQAGCRF